MLPASAFSAGLLPSSPGSSTGGFGSDDSRGGGGGPGVDDLSLPSLADSFHSDLERHRLPSGSGGGAGIGDGWGSIEGARLGAADDDDDGWDRHGTPTTVRKSRSRPRECSLLPFVQLEDVKGRLTRFLISPRAPVVVKLALTLVDEHHDASRSGERRRVPVVLRRPRHAPGRHRPASSATGWCSDGPSRRELALERLFGIVARAVGPDRRQRSRRSRRDRRRSLCSEPAESRTFCFAARRLDERWQAKGREDEYRRRRARRLAHGSEPHPSGAGEGAAPVRRSAHRRKHSKLTTASFSTARAL